jgi:uncharacterized phage protein (TIGR02218 family)
MAAFLEQELTGFALCWRLERRDGVALGFTAHDRDLVIDGFRYRSAPGIAPSAIEEGDVLEADALEVAGALSASALSEADLRSGRWNGAAVRLLAADWSDPTHTLPLSRGELGAVAIERGRFTAELQGPGAKLDMPVTEQTSPSCRAALGDQRCRVDLAGRQQIARVLEASGDVMSLDLPEPVANGWGAGRLRWLDGRNGGLVSHVLASGDNVVTLAEPPAFAVEPGARVHIAEGCDKRFATCRDRFGNAPNFQGEPHLPGIDLLTRYPGE